MANYSPPPLEDRSGILMRKDQLRSIAGSVLSCLLNSSLIEDQYKLVEAIRVIPFDSLGVEIMNNMPHIISIGNSRVIYIYILIQPFMYIDINISNMSVCNSRTKEQ